MKKTLFKCVLVVALGMCLVSTLFFSQAGVAHAASIPHAASRHVSALTTGGGCSYSSDGILYICISNDSRAWSAIANVYIEASLPSCDVWVAFVEVSVLYQQQGSWFNCSNRIGWVGGGTLTPLWTMDLQVYASIQNYYGSTTSGWSPVLYACCS